MKPIVDIAELQEHHLDAMLKLAFDHMDAKEVQQLVDEPDPELTPQEEEMADEIFLMALAKVDKQEKEVRQRKRNSSLKRAFPRILQSAAAIILVFAIATPIAFAYSAEFRSRVMRLIIEIDQSKGEAHYSFSEDADAAFLVPEGWLGVYFPSYIPDGFSVWRVDEYMAAVEFRSLDGAQIYFGEFGESTGSTVGTEDTDIRYIDIQGSKAQIIDGNTETNHTVTITWANDTNMFMVATNGVATDLAIEIAQSVKKIIK